MWSNAKTLVIAMVLSICASSALAVTEPVTVQDTAFSNTNAPRLPVSLMYGHSSTNSANVKYVTVDNASGAIRATGTFYVASNDAWHVYMKMIAPSSTQVAATTTAVDALRVNSASSTQVVATTTAVDNLRINSPSSTQVAATTAAVDALRVNSPSSTQVAATTAAVDALRVNSLSSTQADDLIGAARASSTSMEHAVKYLKPAAATSYWSTPFLASTTALAIPLAAGHYQLAVRLQVSSTRPDASVRCSLNGAEYQMNALATQQAPWIAETTVGSLWSTLLIDSVEDFGTIKGSVEYFFKPPVE